MAARSGNRASAATESPDEDNTAADTGGGTEVTTSVPEPVAVEVETPRKQGGAATAYLNTTTQPVTYDVDGRQVDAGAWTPEINLDHIGQTARRRRYLLPASEL